MSGRTGPSGPSPLEQKIRQLETQVDTIIGEKFRELDRKNIKLVKDFLGIRDIVQSMQESIEKIAKSIHTQNFENTRNIKNTSNNTLINTSKIINISKSKEKYSITIDKEISLLQNKIKFIQNHDYTIFCKYIFGFLSDTYADELEKLSNNSVEQEMNNKGEKFFKEKLPFPPTVGNDIYNKFINKVTNDILKLESDLFVIEDAFFDSRVLMPTIVKFLENKYNGKFNQFISNFKYTSKNDKIESTKSTLNMNYIPKTKNIKYDSYMLLVIDEIISLHDHINKLENQLNKVDMNLITGIYEFFKENNVEFSEFIEKDKKNNSNSNSKYGGNKKKSVKKSIKKSVKKSIKKST
jgi:hypothetical protein